MAGEIVFWILLAVIFYSYIGYGLMIYFLRAVGVLKRRAAELNFYPDVTLVISSYNEEKVLKSKLDNSLALNYPEEKLKIIVVSDGSTDDTMNVLNNYPSVKTIEIVDRKGKTAALNTAMLQVATPFVIFSDANTMLNNDAVINLMQHFNFDKVGAVAGEKKIKNNTGAGDAEGLYWQYESFMKQQDAVLYSVVGATGELFAMRSDLYSSLDEKTILDDFILSINVCLQGYVIAYEPNAFASEAASASLKEEKKRKLRIAAGAFQSLSIIDFKKLRKQPLLFFQFISRRWLRWAVCPTALIIILLLNIFLSISNTSDVYDVLMIFQLIFYIAAIVGWIFLKKNKSFLFTTIPFYFLFMNFCMLQGFFFNRKQSVLWQKAERKI